MPTFVNFTLQVNLNERKLDQNVFPVDAEIGAPLWQFAERHFASNKRGYFQSNFVIKC